ncbi:MAG: AAA family ATPase [Proteobacteria bacterium]|jgi:ATP-dependent DNA helicase PIF1|nr:AAA family ATPase [Pseudomonadota bacterium]
MSFADSIAAIIKQILGEPPGNLSKVSKEIHTRKHIPKVNEEPIEELSEYLKCCELVKAKVPAIFITGQAGTGKSTLIRYLKRQRAFQTVILAPTGVAAMNVGGQTIHSFFRFPPRVLTENDIEVKDKTRAILRNIGLLIIDEVSMVRADMVDWIDQYLREAMYNDKFFGGIPVCFIGDLLQLPPIVKTAEEEKLFSTRYDSAYFYSATCFQDIPMASLALKKVFRQKDDQFIDVLSKIRVNNDHRESVAVLNRLCYGENKDVERSLTLVTTNHQAAIINNDSYKALDTEERTYWGKVVGKFAESVLPAPEELKLKPGARVLFVKNSTHWYNGSLGQVTEVHENHVRVRLLEDGKEHDVYPDKWQSFQYVFDKNAERVNSREVGSYTQIPIIHGWAITIHKSQGLTLDDVRIDLGRGAFASGQTYVALSRCREMGKLSLTVPISMGDVKVDVDLLQFYEKLGLLV